MNLGTLIKFHREKGELTQEELGKGICSVTHISKIERGITQYSSEITDLLSEKLGINLEIELQSLQELEYLFDQWHDSMIMQQANEMERIKKEIEKNPLFLIHSLKNKYFLLHSRYFLIQGNIYQAENLLGKLYINRKKLSTYEIHLLHHLLGMTELIKGDYKKALDYLLLINVKEYLNHEFYYQMAIAYHNLQFKMKAYHYSEIALDYFRKTNNSKKVIDAETIKLINEGRNELWDFDDLVNRYNKLIAHCDIVNEKQKKIVLLANLAFEHFYAEKYRSASGYYKKAMDLLEDDAKSNAYLNNLIGYIDSCLHQEKSEELMDMVELIDKGCKIATAIQDHSSLLFFQMLNLLQKNEKELYYEFIEEKIIPMLEESGKYLELHTYEKTMYQYHLGNRNSEKALKFASRLRDFL